MSMRFTRMHGAGNSIVVMDGRSGYSLEAWQIAALGHAQTGLGFDQLMLIDDGPEGPGYHVFNRDGSRAEQCGNGARCVLAWLWREHGSIPDSMRSPAGRVRCARLPNGRFEVGLGRARYVGEPETISWKGGTATGQRVDMGNPHFVVQCSAPRDIDVASIGAALNQHVAFPNGVNVEWVSVHGTPPQVRVYERGVGETLACGSGACAVAASMFAEARTQDDRLSGSQALALALAGGTLDVRQDADGELYLSGPVCFICDGDIAEDYFSAG